MPSVPPAKNAVCFSGPMSKKPVMPGSLFPRSPTPSSPPEREIATPQGSNVRVNRPRRRKRVGSAPEPPVLQRSSSSQAHPTPNLSSSPHESSPITVKKERSPSVEIIPPPSTPLYRRRDGRPLPPRTPRSRRADHRAPPQHSSPPASVPCTPTSNDIHNDQPQIQAQISSVDASSMLLTPNTNLRRIRSLEEEIQRLRMQVR